MCVCVCMDMILGYYQYKQNRQTNMKNIQGRALHIALLYLHLGLQLAIGYWSTILDYSFCQDQYLLNITYFAYSLIALNLLFIALANSRQNTCGPFLMYLVQVCNLGLLAGVLYMAVMGFLGGNCAAGRVVYQFVFVECGVVGVLGLAAMCGGYGWVDRYLHWPGNLAWPIMFLKWGFPGPFFASALVIGILTSIICCTSFLLHCLTSRSLQLPSTYTTLYRTHWFISMFLLIGCEILAIVMLCTNEKDGDYYWTFARKVFAVFAGVNLVDLGFWGFGYRRLGVWGMPAA